jgi:hypothetical protein
MGISDVAESLIRLGESFARDLNPCLMKKNQHLLLARQVSFIFEHIPCICGFFAFVMRVAKFVSQTWQDLLEFVLVLLVWVLFMRWAVPRFEPEFLFLAASGSEKLKTISMMVPICFIFPPGEAKYSLYEQKVNGFRQKRQYRSCGLALADSV